MLLLISPAQKEYKFEIWGDFNGDKAHFALQDGAVWKDGRPTYIMHFIQGLNPR